MCSCVRILQFVQVYVADLHQPVWLFGVLKLGILQKGDGSLGKRMHFLMSLFKSSTL